MGLTGARGVKGYGLGYRFKKEALIKGLAGAAGFRVRV
jgi:hypothetical protein